MVQRKDGTILRGCGGEPSGLTYMTHSEGESAEADVFALLPEGSTSLQIGGAEVPAVNGVVFFSSAETELLTALRG